MPNPSPDPHRFSIRLRQRPWLGGMAIGLILGAVGTYAGLAIYRPHVPLRGAWRAGRAAETQQVIAESPMGGIRGQAAEPHAHHAPNSRDENGGIDDPPVSARLNVSAPPESPFPLTVRGRTHCRPSRRAVIASAVFRPVVEVLASPGERVTKGQVLIKLYDLEAQAKVRAREMELKSIEAKAQFSKRNMDMAETIPSAGVIPVITLNELRASALSNAAQVLAAEAELSLAQSELQLYSVTAAIDGEIAWLDVSPGAVAWPGSLTWGEIVDLREIDIRCELSPVQADQVAVDQSAEVWLDGNEGATVTGNVVSIGKSADRNSGFIPVMVRADNVDERLRAQVAVNVRFHTKQEK